MKNLYTDGTYLSNNPTWHEEDASFKGKDILKMLSRHNIHPKKVAEIGCGAGAILEYLHQKMEPSVSFSGYEISSQAMEICKKREKDRLHYSLENMLEKEDVFFDVALCMDVIEHVENPFEFLKDLRTKGTWKIIQIPLDISVQSVLTGAIIRDRQEVGHIHYFTKETAFAILAETGYKIIDSFYVDDHLLERPSGFFTKLIHYADKWMNSISPDKAARFFSGFSILFLAK